jgi:hypothetical protein
MGQLLLLPEAAKRLNLTPKQLRWQLYKNQAPPSAVIAGRRMFDEEKLEAWIAEQFEKASA